MNTARYRAVIESTFTDRCDVTVKEGAPGAHGYSSAVTVQTDRVLHAGLPCRLSYIAARSGPSAQGDVSTSAAEAEARLFYPAGKEIPQGAFVTVTHDGVTEAYESAGFARVYATHRETDLLRSARGNAV